MGTMGVDGLSDSVGPYLTGAHHIPLKKEESNTIQSLLQNVEYVDLEASYSVRLTVISARMTRSFTLVI
jgi:hypothetical protein